MYDINKIVISIITGDFLQDLPLAGLNIYYSHQNYSHPGSTVQNKQEDMQKHTQYKTMHAVDLFPYPRKLLHLPEHGNNYRIFNLMSPKNTDLGKRIYF